jgi:putative ABC transport system permease protein
MKFMPLIWSGIWRKPGRTVLVFLQVSVAFALFGVLQGLKSGVDNLIGQARADLLLVRGSVGLADSLPVGLLERIRSVPGVKVAIPVDLSGGIYQNATQKVGIVVVRPDRGWLDAFTYTIKPEYAAAFRQTRTSCLVMEGLAKKYGWKIGDRIPLISPVMQSNGSATWTFDMVGTYTDSDLGGGRDVILVNYDYFDEARLLKKGRINHFNVALFNPAQAAPVSEVIDRQFANSPDETRTESLRQMAQSQMQSIGDLDFLIRAVVGSVLAALLFGTATTMMQSIRERTPELAVLKTLGFTDRAVSTLILIEASVICVAAAGFGLILALFIFPLASRFVPGLSMPVRVVAIGLGCAVLLAVISASVPAFRASRLKIVTALAAR